MIYEYSLLRKQFHECTAIAEMIQISGKSTK